MKALHLRGLLLLSFSLSSRLSPERVPGAGQRYARWIVSIETVEAPVRRHLPDWIRSRGRYWWSAIRAGWPRLWAVLTVLTLVLGGSALALVIFAFDQPLLAISIFLTALLFTLGE